LNIIEKARQNAMASGPLYKSELPPTEEFDIIQMARAEAAASGPTYATVAEIVPQMPTPMVGGGENDPIVIEQIALTGDDNLPNVLDELPALLDEYKTLVMPSWRRFNKSTQRHTESQILRVQRQCVPPRGMLDDERGEAGFDRGVVVLPKSTSRIILVQAVRGRPNIFRQALNYLSNNLGNNQETAVIFAPPFFDPTVSMDINRNLYANFIKSKLFCKKQNIGNLYLLTQWTISNMMVGNCLIQYQRDDPILNMLEPTYIVYPYKDIMPDESVVGGILFSGAAANEQSAPTSSIERVYASIGDYITIGNRGEFAFPPATQAADKMFGKTLAYKVYRFKGPNAFEFQGLHLMKLKSEEYVEVNLEGFDDNSFPPTDSDHLILDNVDYERILLDGRIYSIRNPSSNLSVYQTDWLTQRFTRDEADLLKALNLGRGILERVFEDDDEPWNIQLADFLRNMVISKCYTDTALLTNAACDTSSKFVNKVFEFFLSNHPSIADLRTDEEGAKLREEMLRGQLHRTKIKSRDEAEEQRIRSEEENMSLREHAEAQGVDLRVDLAQISKNPFRDRRLIYVRQGGPLEIHIYQKIGEPRKWCRHIVAIERRSKRYSKAELSVTAENEIEGAAKLQQEFSKLGTEYPGWIFLW